MDRTLIAFGACLFVTIVMAATVGYQWWQRRHSPAARRFGNRLRAVASTPWQDEAAASIMKARALAQIGRAHV